MFKTFFALAVAVVALNAAGEASSALPADRFALAKEFSRRGLHAEALREFESLVGAEGVPGDEFAYHLGEACRAMGRMDAALRQSRKIVEEYPKSRYADYARLSLALAAKGEERFRLFEQLDRKDVPTAVRNAARYHLAFHLAASNDPARRRRAQAIYLDLAGSADARVVEESLFQAGMLSYRDGRYNEAAALFKRLFTVAAGGKRAVEARPFAAWANHLVGHHAETLSIVEAMGTEGGEDAAYLKAVSLAALERREEALKAYDAALKAHPAGRHLDSLWFGRLSQLAAAGDNQGVLAALAKRGDPPAATADRALAFGYEAAARLGDFKRALEYARRAAQLKSPLATRARFMTGAYEARLGNSAEAVRIWSAMLAAEPDTPFAADALRARATEEIRQREYRAANRTYADLARRFPNRARDAQTLYWRGVAARGADDLPEAERLFDAALAAKPSPEFEREIQLERAYLLQKRGDAAGAVRAMSALLGTKAVERIPDAELAWLAETALAEHLADAARTAAETLEKRTKDAAWRQIAAELVGEALDAKGMSDASAAAYRRALAVEVRTDRGAKAALRLGRFMMTAGRNEEAAKILADAVARAQSAELSRVRLEAYSALAANEDVRGFEKSALGYYMLVITLFDDRELVPPAMKRAVEILRKQGKTREAGELAADMKKRYDL